MPRSDYFPVHAHTAFSGMDGMNGPEEHVARVAELGQPAVAFTEHGNMASTVRGYKAAKKHGLAYFPGSEFYLVQDVDLTRSTKSNERWHIGLLALDFKGYQLLTKLSTYSWREERFYYKPLIDLSDLAYLSEEGADSIAVTTGCYSGMVINGWKGPDPAKHALNTIGMLASWFPNTTYVEVQNHGITWPDGTHDIDIATELGTIAWKLGLPLVIGGDSHYVHPQQQPTHDLMKDICYFGDGEDLHFNGGPYHLLSSAEALGAFPPQMRQHIEDSHADLLDRHRVSIPALDKYHFNVPKMFTDPDAELARLVWDEAKKRGMQKIDEIGRINDELEVIKIMGFANYHLLVKTHVTDWCREEGVLFNLRGSGNGSLVNYLLGISEVNPLVWGTDFDRYLSVDRKKPPDLDIDVDFRGRQRLIEHLRAVFPTMIQVGTYSKIGITIDPETGEERGSVIQQYMTAHKRKDPSFAGKVHLHHRKALDDLANTVVYKNMGTNAAGFILPGETLPIDDYLPLARIISSDTTLTQYAKDDVEALGYVKMDILGLRALQTLNGTLIRIGRQPNEWDWIPFDDPRACGLLRSGNCTGIFQYEGWSSQRGGKEMQIRTTHDAILGLALYRPALMNGGQKDLYLANRKAARAKQFRLHKIFDPVLNDTKGVVVFQEQVMQVLKTIGMSFEDYNDLMTAVKASNGNISNAAGTFKRIMPIFYDLCEEKGLNGEEADDAWEAVIGFTEYGFNRAHSSSYGLMSYRSAYLKAHYPLEYMASLLDVWAEVPKKVSIYAQEAKALGFSIVRADVNHSAASWEIEPGRRNAIRKGLVSLPGIGMAVAESIVEHRPPGGYADVDDFIARVPARPVTGGKEWKTKGTPNGVMKTLLEKGAFRSLGLNP